VSVSEDLVRAGYEAFNAGEREPIGEWWHADVVYVTTREDPDAGIREGIPAVVELFRGWVESYPDLRLEAKEIREGARGVFAWVRFTGRGAGSGLPMEMELSQIWFFEDGKVRRCEEYFDRAEGLAAAGLAG
jgi:ketosteroid isomerase-like protein